ncbi:MAG: isochorismatase family cysteine hydrolase [Planctomycetota bacterium]
MKNLQDWTRSALLLVDPQIDLLSPQGGAWDLFGGQVEKRGTVDKMRRLRDAAEAAGVPVFYSRVELSGDELAALEPRNGLQELILSRRLFEQGAGAAFLEELAPTPTSVLLQPRKGPSSVHSDIAEQLRARGIDTLVVTGMVANLCVESQVRDAVDDGFRAIVVGDAVATMSDEAHESALSNFGLLATDVVSTDEVLTSLGA